MILIDWNKDSVALAMENTLLLKKWEGDTSDTSLIGLAQLLHSNALNKIILFFTQTNYNLLHFQALKI